MLAASFKIRYLWGPAVDEILADEQVTSPTQPGITYWQLTDNQGSVRDILTYSSGVTTVADHIVYDSFGNVLSDSSSQTSNPVRHAIGFTGQMQDSATGLDYFKARFYDPRTGQFISADPAKADINTYRYAGNSPKNLTDPSGMDAEDDGDYSGDDYDYDAGEDDYGYMEDNPGESAGDSLDEQTLNEERGEEEDVPLDDMSGMEEDGQIPISNDLGSVTSSNTANSVTGSNEVYKPPVPMLPVTETMGNPLSHEQSSSTLSSLVNLAGQAVSSFTAPIIDATNEAISEIGSSSIWASLTDEASALWDAASTLAETVYTPKVVPYSEYVQQVAQQDKTDEIRDYIAQLGAARNDVHFAVESALGNNGGIANDSSLAAQLAGNKLDLKIEDLRQDLINDPTTAQSVLGDKAQDALSDTFSFQQAVIGMRTPDWLSRLRCHY